jgi:hypothetical protein
MLNIVIKLEPAFKMFYPQLLKFNVDTTDDLDNVKSNCTSGHPFANNSMICVLSSSIISNRKTLIFKAPKEKKKRGEKKTLG